MSTFGRLARSCALTVVTLGVTATTLAVAPAHAADSDTDFRSGAVAFTEGQVKKFDKSLAARRQRAAQQFETRIRSAKQIALNQRGDAYAYGSTGPNAFDCSGLIFYSYRRAGIDVPRTSGAQAGATRRIAKSNMRPGDLMFFANSGGVYHAGIFIGWERGQAMMVQSARPGTRVHVAAPWTSSWFGGTLR